MVLKDYRRLISKIFAGLFVLLLIGIYGGFAVPVSVYGYTKNLEDINFGEWDRITRVNIGPEYKMNNSRYDGIKELCNYHYLAYISVDQRNEDLSSYQGVLYNKDKTVLLCFPQALRKAEIPATCKGLAPDSLYGTSRSVRNQVKRIITINNNGKWPGYTMYVNPINQGQEPEPDDD